MFMRGPGAGGREAGRHRGTKRSPLFTVILLALLLRGLPAAPSALFAALGAVGGALDQFGAYQFKNRHFGAVAGDHFHAVLSKRLFNQISKFRVKADEPAMTILRFSAGSQKSGNCPSAGGASLRRASGRIDGGRVPNFRASTDASTVRAGLSRDVVIDSSSTASVGSVAGLAALVRKLLFSD